MVGTLETVNAEGGNDFKLWEAEMGGQAVEAIMLMERREADAETIGAISIQNSLTN